MIGRGAPSGTSPRGGVAAVDDEGVAGDVTGLGAEKEREDVGQVLGRGDAPEGDERVALGGDPRIGIHLGGHARAHHAG